ncbi:hypothetical protein ACTJKJ_24725 [Roseateles sp. 22389]|jgi:hypothetical protein|uniref:hypothetical protein n=1 Tax=Roseateles sp. 22389 TaxID=3453916 RepID=UPI003F831623
MVDVAARLSSLSLLRRCAVTGSDGNIGAVRLSLIDPSDWRISFLVVETGAWLFGRWVLILPSLLLQPIRPRSMHMDANQRTVRTSPTLHPLQGVSPQQTRATLLHYGQPAPASKDLPLLSDEELGGCELISEGKGMGSVVDLVYDDVTWMLRYLLVDTSAWWQGGPHVLISPHWLAEVDIAAKKIHLTVQREAVRASPRFQDIGTIDRDYETALHRGYGQRPYWMGPAHAG